MLCKQQGTHPSQRGILSLTLLRMASMGRRANVRRLGDGFIVSAFYTANHTASFGLCPHPCSNTVFNI